MTSEKNAARSQSCRSCHARSYRRMHESCSYECMQQRAARMPVHEKLFTWSLTTYAGTVTKIEYNVSRMTAMICASQTMQQPTFHQERSESRCWRLALRAARISKHAEISGILHAYVCFIEKDLNQHRQDRRSYVHPLTSVYRNTSAVNIRANRINEQCKRRSSVSGREATAVCLSNLHHSRTE
jgi:hypothetical protein